MDTVPISFQMYDTVRVVALPSTFDPSLREPKVGDVGVVVMVYDSPTEGYGVEGVDDGRTIWLADFRPDELELWS